MLLIPFPTELHPRYVDVIGLVLSRDIPRLLNLIQTTVLSFPSSLLFIYFTQLFFSQEAKHDKATQEQEYSSSSNPFDTHDMGDSVPWVVDTGSKTKYDNLFFSLNPTGNLPFGGLN